MTSRVIFVSDFFINEVTGGAEFCNDALMNSLKHRFTFEPHKSQTITTQFINANKDCFFVIANFFLLSEECKKALKSTTYVIFEHDHKYILERDPSPYKDFIVPPNRLYNLSFYKNAQAVVCQSKLHAEVLRKNIKSDNIISAGCTLWSKEHLEVLKKY